MYRGLDLGTSCVKALLIDDRQTVIGSGHGSLDVSRPHPGWSEQDPAHWIEACEAAMRMVRSLVATTTLEDWRDWALHVSDDAGDEIFILPFAFAIGKPH